MVSLLMFLALIQAPPEIQALNDQPNAGALYIRYCSSEGLCVARKAICYGTCCDQEEADEIGSGCFGDVVGSIPVGYRYTGWYCTKYHSNEWSRGKVSKNYNAKTCLYTSSKKK